MALNHSMVHIKGNGKQHAGFEVIVIFGKILKKKALPTMSW